MSGRIDNAMRNTPKIMGKVELLLQDIKQVQTNESKCNL